MSDDKPKSSSKSKSSSTSKKSSSTDKKPSSGTDKKSSSSTKKTSSSSHKTSSATKDHGGDHAEANSQHEAQIKKLNEEHSAEVSKLKADIHALEGKVSGLEADVKKAQHDLHEAKNAKKSSSSSSDDGAIAELKDEVSKLEHKSAEQDQTIASLKSKLAAAERDAQDKAAEAAAAADAKAHLAEQTAKVASLEADLTNIKAQNAKANEALQAEVAKLHEKIKVLENQQAQQASIASPRPNQWGKVNTPALAPVGNGAPAAAASDASMPAWKVRQMEKEKEEAEKREAESRAKLTKVSSIKVKGGEISSPAAGSERPNFKDPLLSKQEPAPVHHNPADDVLSPSSLLGGGKTVEELEAEEEARIMKNFGRSGAAGRK